MSTLERAVEQQRGDILLLELQLNQEISAKEALIRGTELNNESALEKIDRLNEIILRAE